MTCRPLAVLLLLALPTTASALELTTPDARVKLTVSGFLHGAAHADTNAAAGRPWLVTVGDETGRGGFSLDPYGSRLSFGVESRLDAAAEAKAKGVVELDWGSVATPRLRHAYVSIEGQGLGVLVGQYWLPNLPISGDTFSPNGLVRQGNTYTRTPQLTVFRSFGPVKAMLTAATAGALTGTVVQRAEDTAKYSVVESALPAGFLQRAWQFAPKRTGALAGGAWRPTVGWTDGGELRTQRYTSLYAEAGANIGAGPLTFSTKLWTGRGGGLGSAVGQSVAMRDDGTAHPILSRGAMLSGRWAVTERLAASLYAGLDDPEDEVAGVAVPIRHNRVLGGTATLSVTEGGLVGAELMNVRTLMTTGAGKVPFFDTRLSLFARYSF